jgi:hypothetical protein
MARRPSAPGSPEETGRDASATHPWLLDVERDRPKWIDRYIDYFGSDEAGVRDSGDRCT